MASTINSLYMLTEMTGRRSNEQRRVIIGTFEMRHRHFWVSVISLAPGLLLMLMLMPAIKEWAVLIPPVTLGLGFLFAEARSRTGLKQRYYKDLIAKAKSNINQFTLAGHPIEVSGAKFGAITATSVPLHPSPTAAGSDLIEVAQSPAPRRRGGSR